jgi:hypothetical protein
MAALKEELASIYFADVRYWRQGTKASREATREYQSRQDRVREIRREVRDLLNTKALFWYAGCYFSGITTTSSLGMMSSVALSIPRWAITRSGGVWVSHSDKARSW